MKSNYFYLIWFCLFGLVGCNSDHSGFPTDPDNGNAAPQANDVTLHGDIYRPGFTVFLSGTYYDEENDSADEHSYRWLRGEVVIPEATSYRYTLTGDDANQKVLGCVTPKAKRGTRSGLEACAEVTVGSAIDLSNPPTATIQIDKTKLALAGSSMSSQYDFTSPISSGEGSSLFVWVHFVNHLPKVTLCPSGELIDCTQTIPENVAGYPIESCVLPIDDRNVPGSPVCDNVTGAGLSLSGKLEYRQNLYANIEGFPNDTTYHWIIDVSNKDGPAGNIDESTDIATGVTSYNIGSVNALASDTNYVDTNSNGVVDDHDWQDSSGHSQLSAEYYVGKNIKFCARTSLASPDDEHCLYAADMQNKDGSLCIDSSSCITGGVYYNSNSLTSRGIEPARVVELSEPNTAIVLDGTVKFHRPISVAEYELRETLGLGDLPSPTTPLSQLGIDWIRYKNGPPSPTSGSSGALDYCLNLNSANENNWFLPVASDTYNTDSHSGDNGGNAAPTGTGQHLKGLADGLIYHNSYDAVSQTYGWPIDVTFATASQANSSNHYTVKLSTGAAQGYSSDSYSYLVSCVAQ